MKQKSQLSTITTVFGFLIVFAVSSALASPGDIDSTFRSGGFATSAFGGAAYASAVQADDKIIVVGRANEPGFTLLRYNADGILDPSFGTNGRVTTNIDGDNELPFAATVQPDGKIVIVGQFQNGGDFQYDFGIVRYNSDGTLDNTFGNAGKTSISIGDREDVARSIIIQPDGKLLVGGSAYFVGNTAAGRFAVLRFNRNGTLDSTFDGDGKAIIQQNGFGDIALQSDGKIVVASSDGYGFESTFAISRLNADGSLDAGFGNNGKVNTVFGDGGSAVGSLVLQADGKTIAVGVSHVNGSQRSDFGLARYNIDGSLDATFGGDGKVITSFGSTDDTANKVVLQSDNKILVAGAAQGNNDAPSKGFAVARYNTDGSLDAAFGNAGKATSNLLGDDFAYDAQLQTNGKLLVVGSGGGSPARYVTIRLTATGILDQSFNPGVAGRVTVSLGEINVANDVIIQPDGKILTVGATSTAFLLDFSLARFNADGTPDLTFGVGGKVSTSVSSSIDGAEAVALQPDGKIVAVGYAGFPGNTDVAVVRYNPDGTLDRTFDTDGIVILPRQSSSDAAVGVVIQLDGKIVTGGYTSVNNLQEFFLARFNTNGALDSTFGTNGIVTTDIGAGDDFAKALIQQNDGRLIAVGTSRSGPNAGDFAVVRYTADGALDATFGTNGKVVTSIGSGNDDATAVVLQTDGKIVVAGNATENSRTNVALVRYNSNGVLDDSFASGGKTITFLPNSSVAADVIIQPSGRIMVVGSLLIGSTSDIAIFRFNTTGLLDATFGTGGTVFNDINNNRDVANAVTLQGNDKIIVAGGSYVNSQGSTRSELVVLRYQANTEVNFDFDGDGKAEVSVFRPTDGAWYSLNSSSGFTGVQFGISSDKLAPADYDGDGKTDIAVYRDGTWYLQRSTQGFTGVGFGVATDIPTPADYDGDGKAEIAVYRPSNGTWYIYNLATNQTSSAAFGASEDKPTAADYDGDGKTDFAVFRPSNGTWYLQRSAAGFRGVTFGESTDQPVVGDYDGDGKADVAVFRPSNGTWYLLQSTAGFTGIAFGLGSDLPVAADYDGDGKIDVAVFRSGTWYIQRSTAGFTGVAFGAVADQPVPNAFFP